MPAPANGAAWSFTNEGTPCTASYPWVFNTCSPAAGATLAVPGVCLTGNGGALENEAAAVCASLGAPGEWALDSVVADGCGALNLGLGPGNPSVAGGAVTACCKDFDNILSCAGSSATRGSQVVCARRAFTGDPVACCLADLACRGRDSPYPAALAPLCFTPAGAGGSAAPPVDPALGCPANGSVPCPAARTCAPAHRDAGGTGCGPPLAAYCAGEDGDPAWLGRWVQPDGAPAPGGCLYALQRRLFSVGGPAGVCGTGPAPPPGAACGALFGGADSVDATSAGALWASDVLERALATYRRQGFVLGAPPGAPGYSVFQEFLYAHVCCPYPAVCQAALRRACRPLSVGDLALSPAAARLCGCHLPPRAYAQYTDRYQIGVPCAPPCSRVGAVPLTDGAGAPLPCAQNVCLVDGVALALAETDVSGRVSVAQLCGGCSQGANATCACLVQDDAVDAVAARVGSVDLGTACGSATCARRGAGGVSYAPCPTGPAPRPPGAPARSPRLARLALGAAAFVAALFLVVLALAALRPPLRRAPSR